MTEAHTNSIPHRDMATAIRALAIDAVEAAKSGHPGMPMGMADVATVLFTRFLKFDPRNPKWPDRDRFVLSAGHGSMLLYSVLHLTGYKDISLDDIKRFRQLDSSVTREHGGSGLGLAISKELVQMLGGSIRVDSELGKGSRFTVILPVECPETVNRPLPSLT